MGNGQFQVVPRTGPFRVLPRTVNGTPQNSERSQESSSASSWFHLLTFKVFRSSNASKLIDVFEEKKER
jgi:hypothetical protein